MSKFSMKMKVQGFELEINGTREDAEKLTQAIKEQMAGLLPPVGTILDGATPADNDDLPLFNVTPSAEPAAKKPRRKRIQAIPATGGSGDKINSLPAYAHDPEKFGTPSQDWKTAEKAVWTLYCVKESGGPTELSGKVIADLFNTHFRESGTIKTGNVNRDLGRLKTEEKPSPVADDAVKGVWYLTDTGIRRAQNLVALARGERK
jgi:hypothetical protein